ncbi:DinB family protein [Rhizobiaceae bacterium BDR2-2]|uniref:DinB family protein n=1 Tax=Ectorhizobium quercum TaxID=2965071 RepID=A0AAE3N5P7_9HYPH|nr:DinB family protein [Ectorhizobium quercum]MCX8999017.1 DinB family protein [Ectorhizobium quercum]
MLRHFRMFADYNRWANERVYAACAELSEDEFRADKGAFFSSAQRTLNHILVADRIWMKRLTGTGEAPEALDTVLFEDFDALEAARQVEDARIAAWLDGLTQDDLAKPLTYSNVAGTAHFTQPVAPVLTHIFNHQTHHRGQAHVILTALGKPSLVLDLLAFLRTDGRHWQ